MSAPRFPALRFALREMRGSWRGSGIFLACLALGVGAIMAVLSLSNGMMAGLQADGQRLLGGDLAIRTLYKPPSAEQIGKLARLSAGQTLVSEMRAMVLAGTKTAMVEIKAIDDSYPLYGHFEMTGAEGAPAALQADEAAVAPEILLRLAARIGDSVKVGQRTIIIGGVIAMEPDRVSGAGYSLAPRMIMKRDTFAATGLEGFGSQASYDLRLKAMPPDQSEELRTKVEAAFPDAGWRLRDVTKAAPQVERLINRLTLFLTLISLTTLLVGGVGISNAVKSYLDDKMPSIATFKALGASGTLVFRIYFLQVAALAVIGIALGIITGMGAAQLAGAFLASRFGLPHMAGFDMGALLLATIFGLLMTLTFSLWPLGRALQVRAVDLFRDQLLPELKLPSQRIISAIAISALSLAVLAVTTAFMPWLAFYFVVGACVAVLAFGALSIAIQRLLGRLPVFSSPELRLSARNLSRPGNSTTSVILSLGLGLTVLVAIANIEYSFSRMLKEDLAADTPSFFFLDIQPDQRADFEETMATAPSMRALQLTPSFRGRITRVNGSPAETMLKDRNEEWVIRSDRGFTVAATQPPHSTITAGEWWPEDYHGAPLVSIAGNVARAFEIGVGDRLTVNIMGIDTEATVANVRDIEWASFTMNFAVTFAPGFLDRAPANAIATAVVDEGEEEALQTAIVARFPNITVVRIRDALTTVQSLLKTIAIAVRVSAVITLIAGLLVLSGGIAAARSRHIYDAVILKVLGATRMRIFKAFLLEYFFLGAVTAGIAAILGTAASYAALKLVMDLPWHFGFWPLVSVVTVSLLMTLTAGFAGTWHILGQKPAGYLRNT